MLKMMAKVADLQSQITKLPQVTQERYLKPQGMLLDNSQLNLG